MGDDPGAPDRWLALTVHAPGRPDAAERLPEGLVALGGRAVQEDGEKAEWTTYVPPPSDPDAFASTAAARLRELTGLDDLRVTWVWQPQENWAHFWRRGLSPRRIGPRLVVTPTWEDPHAASDEVVVRLDPGMAFGTAEHATTRGCLRLLQRVLPADEVDPPLEILDVGTGSAILAVAAALLGARRVLGVESDPLACQVARENVEANGVATRVEVRHARVSSEDLAALGSFDVVLANLDTGLLLPLLPGIAAAGRPGGWVVLSGVLTPEAARVRRRAREEGLTPDAEELEEGWWSGLFRVGWSRAPGSPPRSAPGGDSPPPSGSGPGEEGSGGSPRPRSGPGRSRSP